MDVQDGIVHIQEGLDLDQNPLVPANQQRQDLDRDLWCLSLVHMMQRTLFTTLWTILHPTLIILGLILVTTLWTV